MLVSLLTIEHLVGVRLEGAMPLEGVLLHVL